MTAIQDALTQLSGQIDASSAIMAAAVAEIQKDVAALAAANDAGDSAAVTALSAKLKASTDALQAAIPVTASESASAAP